METLDQDENIILSIYPDKVRDLEMSVMQSMRTYHLSRCLITLLLISISFLKDIFNQGFEARFPLPLQLSPQLCLGYLTSTVTNVHFLFITTIQYTGT